MALASTWLTTILGFLVVLALIADGRSDAGKSVDFIDCKYRNPELHMYMDSIDICLP
jgi:hypothetical protein